ncbi:hypothetical protein JDV02_007533 [Purpureocillium takamizusanense]|uniref:Uncharacterized protein n=1 Tax=Purpureocillium takamizusanense TaxID=2060973 RepID=A0A9Q8QKE6_9HYPO|nr:uncharacterized protein JDV02_007533 [Purpureocillium takamizusanense]UNI21553.1 hypothetical protein JDV02_007533 [Purpureocillium takamizusanense]
MAAPLPRAKDPLDALQLLVNDVLVQTGKALRASRRDSQGNVGLAHPSAQAKLPDTIKAFHAALDDLENDIIRAKSVLLRDLDELKAQKTRNNGLAEPRPIESQSKPPMAIDLDSSPPSAPNDQSVKAPVADMGMSLGEGLDPDSATKEGATPAAQISPAAINQEQVNQESDTGSGVPPGESALMDSHVNGADMMGSNSGLNFTNMEFTLAPNNDSQEQNGGDISNMNAAGPTFDLTSFARTDGADGNNMASLDNMVPADLGGQSGASMHEGKGSDAKLSTEAPDAAYADIFAGDGQTDGMDFDFSIDGGMGGDTFDDMMNDRDNTYDPMEHGDFDTNFFGLSKTDDV